MENDKSLDIETLTCLGIPSFETAEGFDCGEGIHLLGSDHNTVSNNIVERNAGGILISDDTWPVHDNYVSNNTGGTVDATNNYWGCTGGPGKNGCSKTSGNVCLFRSSVNHSERVPTFALREGGIPFFWLDETMKRYQA